MKIKLENKWLNFIVAILTLTTAIIGLIIVLIQLKLVG